MAQERIKIVFESTGEEGIYRAVCIEDDAGNLLQGSWQDTRPWHSDHGVRVIWAEDPEARRENLHKITVDGKDVSEALEDQANS